MHSEEKMPQPKVLGQTTGWVSGNDTPYVIYIIAGKIIIPKLIKGV